jgi:hypothetical protein
MGLFDDKFVRVYDNGLYVVAEFHRPLGFFVGDGTISRAFVLNEKYLRERMENRKRYGLSVSEEVAALSAIEEFKNGQAINNAS